METHSVNADVLEQLEQEPFPTETWAMFSNRDIGQLIRDAFLELERRYGPCYDPRTWDSDNEGKPESEYSHRPL